MTIGNVTTARWLNTAVTLCRVYLSRHGLIGENARNLGLIINFIVSYYFPNYYFIKVSEFIPFLEHITKMKPHLISRIPLSLNFHNPN